MILHECGHMTALFIMKKRVLEVRLELFGAVIRPEPLNVREELLCTLAGPTVNLIVWMLSFRCVPFAACVSAALFAFNMLPIYPLDGGRVLFCLLEGRLQQDTLRRVVHIISLIVSLFVMLAAASVCVNEKNGIFIIFISALVLLRLGKAAEREGC